MFFMKFAVPQVRRTPLYHSRTFYRWIYVCFLLLSGRKAWNPDFSIFCLRRDSNKFERIPVLVKNTRAQHRVDGEIVISGEEVGWTRWETIPNMSATRTQTAPKPPNPDHRRPAEWSDAILAHFLPSVGPPAGQSDSILCEFIRVFLWLID